MHVAFYVSKFPPRHESFVVNQIKGIVARGHRVTVIARSRGPKKNLLTNEPDLVRPAVHYRPQVSGGRCVRGLKFLLQKVRTAFPGEQPVGFDHSSDRNEAAPFEDICRFDILHCQHGTLGKRAVELRQRGVFESPIVVALRGFDLTGVIEADPHSYHSMLREADLLLPVCHSFRERLIGIGAPPQRTHVLHSAIDLTRFPFRARTLPNCEAIRAVAVGRLIEKKGFDVLIRALARLKDRKVAIQLTIVGDGPLGEDLRNLACSLNVNEEVAFLSWRSPAELISILNSADLFVCPSRTAVNGDQEGIPNTLKEAMALGLPVLATRHSGIPELVTDGEHGILVDEGDSAALEMGFLRLKSEQTQQVDRAKQARARICKEYDLEKLSDQLLSEYRLALSNYADANLERHRISCFAGEQR